MSEGDFLSRWSRRKHEARRQAADAAPVEAPVVPLSEPETARGAANRPPSEVASGPAPLPPVEALTPDSDFTPFMSGEVDPDVRRQALRTLFRDPRFNVMDGLDVYIDDYSKPDPLPPEWLGTMRAMDRLGDFFKTPPPEPAADSSADGVPIPDPKQAPGSLPVLAESPPAGAGSPPSDSQES